MPAGALVTLPDPDRLTCNRNVLAATGLNVAATLRAAVIGTVQAPVPGQAIPLPLQPVKVLPLAGAAVSVTEVPLV